MAVYEVNIHAWKNIKSLNCAAHLHIHTHTHTQTLTQIHKNKWSLVINVRKHTQTHTPWLSRPVFPAVMINELLMFPWCHNLTVDIHFQIISQSHVSFLMTQNPSKTLPWYRASTNPLRLFWVNVTHLNIYSLGARQFANVALVYCAVLSCSFQGPSYCLQNRELPGAICPVWPLNKAF